MSISQRIDYSKLALDRIESILNKLKIDYVCNRDDIIEIICPVHGSDNMGHSIIYKNTGVWLCFSGNCHDEYGKTILGLIKGTLEKNNLPSSWQDIRDFINSDHVVNVKNTVYKEPDLFKDEKTKPETLLPSRYFLARGYSEKSLNYFEIGDCVRGPYINRAIVPVRFMHNEYMGFSARIHWPACKSCGYHHSKYETCLSPNHDFHFMYKKWYHSKGMQKSKTLYGIHKIPFGTKKVALVEGPGCVWKLYDYNIPTVACMGKDFNKTRLQLLQSLGVESVLFMPDKDAAGDEFKTRFINTYSRDLKIIFPKLTSKDVSEMNDEDIKKFIVDKWEKI